MIGLIATLAMALEPTPVSGQSPLVREEHVHQWQFLATFDGRRTMWIDTQWKSTFDIDGKLHPVILVRVEVQKVGEDEYFDNTIVVDCLARKMGQWQEVIRYEGSTEVDWQTYEPAKMNFGSKNPDPTELQAIAIACSN